MVIWAIFDKYLGATRMLHYLGLSVVHYLNFLISMLSPYNDIVFRLLVGLPPIGDFPLEYPQKLFWANFVQTERTHDTTRTQNASHVIIIQV